MPTAEEQVTFLEGVADDVQPVIYYDPDGERHRVIVQQLAQTHPYKHGDRYEPVMQLTMIDAWAGMEAQGASAAQVQTATECSLYDQVTADWSGAYRWGFFSWQ